MTSQSLGQAAQDINCEPRVRITGRRGCPWFGRRKGGLRDVERQYVVTLGRGSFHREWSSSLIRGTTLMRCIFLANLRHRFFSSPFQIGGAANLHPVLQAFFEDVV